MDKLNTLANAKINGVKPESVLLFSAAIDRVLGFMHHIMINTVSRDGMHHIITVINTVSRDHHGGGGHTRGGDNNDDEQRDDQEEAASEAYFKQHMIAIAHDVQCLHDTLVYAQTPEIMRAVSQALTARMLAPLQHYFEWATTHYYTKSSGGAFSPTVNQPLKQLLHAVRTVHTFPSSRHEREKQQMIGSGPLIINTVVATKNKKKMELRLTPFLQ